MTRVRKHHEFVQRPVWDRLGPDAYMLHDAALSYVNAHLTDGLLPRSKAKTLHSAVRAPQRQIRGLLDEGIWTEHDDAHYRVCDVQDDLRLGGGRGDEQPSAAYVESEQDRARARKTKWRENRQPNGARNSPRNGVPARVRSRTQDSAGQGRAVQDPGGSSPAPRPTLVPDQDCEHGVDLHAGCRECSSLQVAQ